MSGLALSSPTTAIQISNHRHECVDEMENCSLKDNERCNCVWQMMRAVHGIFHWINSVSCVHRRKRCRSSSSIASQRGEELRDIGGSDIGGSDTPTFSGSSQNSLVVLTHQPSPKNSSSDTTLASIDDLQKRQESMTDRLAEQTDRILDKM